MNITSQTPRFRIFLFGGPDLLVGEDPCPLSPLQKGLLGLLYGNEGDGMDREEVISVLWPDDDPRRARRRLNQLLYSIKTKAGSPTPFKSRGDRILKRETQVSSDLQTYLGHLRACRLAECTSSLSKGFLRKSNGQVSTVFSEWIEDRERDLRRVLGNKLREHLTRCESTAAWEGAREAAESISALNPLDESALRSLIKARARVSGLLDAEAAVAEFANRRETALGSVWTPREETLSLLRKMRSEPGSLAPDSSSDSPGDQKEPRLVGRDGERTLLRRSLMTPPQRFLRGILVSGEAGIGKTRLIRESVFGLNLEGQSVFLGRQAELEQLIALNPLIEAFREPRIEETLSHLDEPWRAVLYGVMPSHFRGEGPVPQAPQIQPGSVPRRLFEAFHQLLLALVAESPVVLVLDDLQWADETTLAVLDFLVRRWDRGRLQALFSLRSQEIHRTSALRSFLGTLRVHHDFLEVPLRDLNKSASRTLIRDISGKSLSGPELAHLYSLAGGNPFFLIELTLEYLAGRVDHPSFPDDVLSIPLSIRQVLERRLSQLSPAAQKTLGALSVHSKPLNIKDLARVADLTVAECMTGLDQLHGFRLVRSAGFEISVGHELIRRTLYQRLPASRKAWLHLRLARLLQASSSNPPADELAIHFHHAGAAEEARDFAREAAERAETSGAIPEALRFLGIAREHTDDPEAVAAIVGRMGHLNYLHQNLEEAAPLLEAAAQRFHRQGKDAEALEAELERVDSLGQTGLFPSRECLDELERIKREAQDRGLWETFMKALNVEARAEELCGNLDGVRQILAQAAAHAAEGGPEAHCYAHALLALNTYFGSARIGLNSARRAVGIAQKTTNEYLLLHALNRLIIALHHQGMLNLPEGQAALAQAEKRLGTCGDLILKFFIRQNAAVWLLENGELGKAVNAFHTVENVIQGTRATKPLVMLNINLGELHLDAHDVDQAKRSYRKAEGYLSSSSLPYHRTIINAGLGLCALQDGGLHEARSREEALDPDPAFWTFDPTVISVFRARMMIRRGDADGAIGHLARIRRAIKERFFSAWVRLLIEEGRIRKRSDRPYLMEDIGEAIKHCTRFRLDRRREELTNLRSNPVS
jgi:DNA-binding SARP family transcriptional activator/tetratricopeptide (TPR) repeat protein